MYVAYRINSKLTNILKNSVHDKKNSIYRICTLYFFIILKIKDQEHLIIINTKLRKKKILFELLAKCIFKFANVKFHVFSHNKFL